MYIKLICIFGLLLTSLNAVVIPIVTVEENGRLEELADETGANEWRFMTNAGLAVSEEAEKMIHFNKKCKTIVLVGKGYNGGNALWAGFLLKQKGYDVEAYRLFLTSDSPLISQKIMRMFEDIGGSIQAFHPSIDSDTSLIIDGILGASFQGGADGVLAEAINWANTSKQPILSVDIPSGLNGDTGEAKTVAIKAKHTVTFFFPRVGFFIRSGFNHVGNLSVVNLGIKSEILSLINPTAYLMSHDESTKYLGSDDIFILDRQSFEKHLGSKPEFTFEEIQNYSDKNQLTIFFTDNPKTLVAPFQKPIIFDDIHLYKVSEKGQISEIFNFFKDNDL